MILWVDQNITNSSLEASQWSFHWAYTSFTGCHQVATRGFQCEKSEVRIHSLLMFEGLWQPLVSKVTGIGSPAEVRSWDPRVLWCHAHPRCYPAKLSEIANWNLKNVKFWGMDEGALPPTTPINPSLGGDTWQKMSHFWPVCSFMHTLETSVWS